MKLATRWILSAVGVLAALSAPAETVADITNPIEDIAYQVVCRLNADKRVRESVRTVAFVSLADDKGATFWKDSSDIAVVFESALAAAPGDLRFVAHAEHERDWMMIDAIFKQARDMSSWDPKTCPELKKLKLCDALLVGQFIRSEVDGDAGVVVAKMAFQLIRVATGEKIWGGVIEGRYSRGGPDNEQVSLNWRRALEACAANAVEKLPKSLEGYGVLILPIEGKSGTAMGQVFLNALTTAGKLDKIAVYDLPRGNVEDRMFSRFLGDRGAQSVRDSDLGRRSIGQYVTARKMPEKLVVLSGMVSVVNENPKFELNGMGLPVDFIGGAEAVAAQQRKSYEVVCDFKFRDVNDSFRLIGSIGATGLYAPPALPAKPATFLDRARRFLNELFSFLRDGAVARVVQILLALVAILVCWRWIRKIVGHASRPR